MKVKISFSKLLIRDRREVRRNGIKTGGEIADMADATMSSFDWIVISLVIIYIVGELLASQAGKLSGTRQLRKLSGRKSIGNMGARGSSMARGSRYGGRGSAMARGSFMVNMGIAEEAEDENNEEFQDKTQPEGIMEVDETDDQPMDEQPAEISDNQDEQKAVGEIEGMVSSLFSYF